MKSCMMIALGVALASVLFAEPAAQGFYADQNIQASYNNLGVQLGTKFLYRVPLVKEKGVLWESTKIDLGLENSASPAFDFVGAFVDIEPIAVFDLALKAQVAGYFKALGFGFHNLAGYGSAFDTSTLASLPSKDTTGYELSAAPTLKFAIWRFAFSNTLHINYFNVDGGSGYFYETIAGCPLAKSGVELYNDAYALYLASEGIYLGLNDSILYIPGSGYRSHCLQAVGAFTRPLSEKLQLYAALTTGTYLEDRYLQNIPHVAGEAGITYRF